MKQIGSRLIHLPYNRRDNNTEFLIQKLDTCRDIVRYRRFKRDWRRTASFDNDESLLSIICVVLSEWTYNDGVELYTSKSKRFTSYNAHSPPFNKRQQSKVRRCTRSSVYWILCVDEVIATIEDRKVARALHKISDSKLTGSNRTRTRRQFFECNHFH